jgi:hypothetical protein
MQDLPTDAINLEGEGAAAVIGVDSAALGCAILLLPHLVWILGFVNAVFLEADYHDS